MEKEKQGQLTVGLIVGGALLGALLPSMCGGDDASDDAPVAQAQETARSNAEALPKVPAYTATPSQGNSDDRVCINLETGEQEPCPGSEEVAKLPSQMSWSEAEQFLKKRGPFDLRVGSDNKSLRGAYKANNELIVFDFKANGSNEPPTCIFVDWQEPGDWKKAVLDFYGADASKLSKKRAEQGKKAFRLESPSGPIWIRASKNYADPGNGAMGVSMGPDCDLIHD